MELGKLTPTEVFHISCEAMLSRESCRVEDDADYQLSGAGWTWISRLWAIFFSCIVRLSRFCFVSFSFSYRPFPLPFKNLLICLYLNSWAFALLSFCIFSHHMEGKSGYVMFCCLMRLNPNSNLCMASHCSVLYWVNKLFPIVRAWNRAWLKHWYKVLLVITKTALKKKSITKEGSLKIPDWDFGL